MKDILSEIIANKFVEVEALKKNVPMDVLVSSLRANLRPVISMSKSLKASATGIIAEFKRKSPSKGLLFPDARVEDVVPYYERNGAAACSILTDEVFFGGTLQDLKNARKQVTLPLLRKDFIIDEYQLYEARVAGADAVLLIASVLTKEDTLRLARKAHELGLETLLEIHSDKEVEWLNSHIDMLGVNNRNLGSFHTDIKNSQNLMEKIKDHLKCTGYTPVLISESGIDNSEVVKQLRSVGFGGFLIGEQFMKHDDPGAALHQFIGGITV